MNRTALRLAGLAAAIMIWSSLATSAQANGRQYYGNWNFHPQRSYHYCNYYYKPTPTYNGYHYHYCIYVPSQPRYIYYYNPHRQVYWGRFDLEGKPGEQYSLLTEENRKKSLADIPESAFPKPAAMPQVPDAEDTVSIDPPPGRPEQ
ncbi:MAG: hypothetical protein ACK5Q5_20275 [Planctomycetaceae bacterium]